MPDATACQADFFAAVPNERRIGEYPIPKIGTIESCRSCGAQIVWARTPSDRAVPLSLATVQTRGGVRCERLEYKAMSKGRTPPPAPIDHAARLRDRLGKAAYEAAPHAKPWEQLREETREFHRTVGQAVMDVIIDKGDQRGEFAVSSIYGYATQQPYVTIEVSMSPMQVSPAKARELALMLLESADASESDAVLIGYARNVLDLDDRGAAQLVHQFRQYRDKQRGEKATSA